MVRWLSLGSVVFLSACSSSGLNPLAENDYAYAEDLFTTGSQEEMRLAETLAYEHLYGDSERALAGVTEIWTERVVIDDLHQAHVRIEQTVEGVPVFGGEGIVHLNPDGTVRDITDNWVRHVDLDTEPLYTEDEALDYAAYHAGGWEGVTNLPEAKLKVLRHGNVDRLVYQVDLQRLDGTSRTEMPRVFVDAKTGALVWKYDNLQTLTGSANTDYNGSITFPVSASGSGSELRGEGIGTYTFDNEQPWWSSVNASHLQDVRSASTNFSDEAAADAHFGVHQTVGYFAETFGRNGIDGNGGPRVKDAVMTTGVHYGEAYNNAFWNGSAMVFGDGDGNSFSHLASLDIAAHEMTHGITEFSADLVYQGESGALNESMSDVFAVLVEAWVRGESADIWKIGEDCYTPFNGSVDALRYMDRPADDGSSRDHYDDRYTGNADNGGVHWNSGIANLAFYLAVDGGQHPSPARRMVVVDGIGLEKAGAIWYRGLTQYMTAFTNFANARVALVNAAEDLYGPGSAEVIAVTNAWAEVGVGEAVANPEPNPEPEPEPGPQPGPSPEDGNAEDLSGAAGDWVPLTVEVPVGATALRIAMSGGTGDADLYVRYVDVPTEEEWDCRPYRGGNVEDCVFDDPTPGTWRIAVRGFTAFTGVDVHTTVTGSAAEPEPDGSTGEFLDEDGLSGERFDEQRFELDVPAGQSQLVVRMTGGTGDADLYVQFDDAPTTAEYTCRPFRSGNEEECIIDNPTAGTWHVMVRGYSAYEDVSLTGTWE